MPRRAAAQIRPVEADSIHRSKLVQQVINKVMLDGKKSTAERIVYDALALLAERSDKDPGEAPETSIKVLTPSLAVRTRRAASRVGARAGGGAATHGRAPVAAPRGPPGAGGGGWGVTPPRQRREK